MHALIVDDHPAVHAVLERVLGDEPDLVPIAAVATARDALALARHLAPDVAVVDYELFSGEDGRSLALRLKALARPPRVLIYSAYADARRPSRRSSPAPTGSRIRAAAAVYRGGTALTPVQAVSSGGASREHTNARWASLRPLEP